jgi:predicted DNA-binding transcriptional regulator YafY
VRASRLLQILLLLHTRGRISAQHLADELEVSLRTVYRDVEALGSAGIPIYATRGRNGGFHLLAGYRSRLTDLTGLSGDEADAVLLAGIPSAAADLGLGGVFAATQLKLLAALPPELRERATRIRDRFHLDAPGWQRDADAPVHLTVIAGAVWSQQRVQVRYLRSNRVVVQRVLEPLGLVLKAGTWYLVATVAAAGPSESVSASDAPGEDGPAPGRGPRTYRASRIQAAIVLNETFERPAGFDLEQHWTEYQRDYEERIFRSTATIRLTEAGRSLLFLIGSAAARAGHEQMGRADADGWAQTTVPIESVNHAQHALLQLGAEVVVVEPEELRARMAAQARRLVERYADGPVSGE